MVDRDAREVEGGAGGRLTVAVFSGGTATIENTPPLLTGGLRAQRLAAPVTVYIEAFSAHPLERDAAHLYAPPDGYIDAEGTFSRTRRSPHDTPVHEAVLRPEDGLHLLPYLARQADGGPWQAAGGSPDAAPEDSRQTFFPDASRLFEEIDRFCLDDDGRNGILSALGDYAFFRASPSAGYSRGLSADERTDEGDGPIPPETRGQHYFTYLPRHLSQEPSMVALARLTNVVQRALAPGAFDGALWLEGSPAVEETLYWLNLVVDCAVPLCGTSAQRPHGTTSSDGARNILDALSYVRSRIWAGEDGRDAIGAVVVQDARVFTARDVQKADARPGGYVTTGGHGGVIATVGAPGGPVLTFRPVRRHTAGSEVNLRRMPSEVLGVSGSDANGFRHVVVPVKDGEGDLLASAIPKVTFCKYGRYGMNDHHDDPADEVEISARIAENGRRFPLAGFALEGSAPFGRTYESMTAALERAVFCGMPVVCVGRGNAEGFVPEPPNGLFVAGANLTATKARLLLMACMLRFGSPPPAREPDRPTAQERAATVAHLAQFREVFRTH